MMKNKNIYAFSIGLILLIIGTFSFIYWGQKKEVWFCDEIYSYESANGFEQEWPSEEKGIWMTGEDIEDFMAADSDELSLNSITVRLYNDHVPLYFWLFRMVSLFIFKGSATIWIGLSINLFFYLFVLALGYWMFWHLTKKPMVSAVVMIVIGVVNRLMLMQATMLRMYMMLLWVELLLLLAGFWILRDVERDKMSPWVFIYMFFASVTGLLTHYDYWIFYAVTATLFCMWLLVVAVKKKKKVFWVSREFKYVLAWVGNFGVSLFVTTLIFPYCKWNLNRGKGKMALSAVFDFSAEKLQNIAWGYERLVASAFGGIVSTGCGFALMCGCILGGAVVLYKRKDISKLVGMILTVLVSQGYQFIVCFTLPDAREERYLWGTFTFMAACMAWGAVLLLQELFSIIKTETIRKKIQWIAGIVLTAFVLCMELKIIDGGNQIAYLFHGDKDVALLEEYSEVPWVVYGPTLGVYSYYDWLIPEQICFVTQYGTPEDVAALRVLEDEDYFVIYLHEGYYDQALELLQRELQKELTGKYLTQSTNLNVYLISTQGTE